MKRNKKKNIYLLLFIILCSFGIGYAFLRTELSINGTADFLDARWDIHFNNLIINPNSVELSTGNIAASISASTTEVTYAVTLKEPGDFYEFTVDAVNAGTMDAMIETISSKMGGVEITTLPSYMEYSVTYSDDMPLEVNQYLKAGDTETYKVHIGFKKDINASDLTGQVESKTFSFDVTYIQADESAVDRPLTFYGMLSKNSKIDNISSTYVTNANGIQFDAISSDTNGKGFYLRAGTEYNTHPIYYYRGVVDNNILFGGFCWKIVRTTETGGLKIVYNGLPNGTNNNECNNTGADTQLSTTTKYNTSDTSPADVGYMYGTRYSQSSETGTGWLYSPDVVYNSGTYTLTNKNVGGTVYAVETKSSLGDDNLNYHHYTCGNSTDTSCNSVKYVFYISDSAVYYITLENGKKIENAISEMLTNSSNTTNSTIKTIIDNWFQDNLVSYVDKIEDTIWCNDRSIASLGGFNPLGGSVTESLVFNASNRSYVTFQPNLECMNKNDSFTVTETSKGNGKLTYPVGLLTGDELKLAGGNGESNTTFYLYTSKTFWSLTTLSYQNSAANLRCATTGSLGKNDVDTVRGIRPAISLKPGTIISNGDGTTANPFTVE